MKWIKDLFSNVIANIIATLIVTITGIVAIVQGWIPIALKFIKNSFKGLYESIKELLIIYPLQGTIVILVLLVIYLSFEKIKHWLPKKNNKSGLKWLKSLSDNEFERFQFLIWFPVNHNLVSDYSHTDIHTIPEVSILLKKNVFNQDENYFSRYEISQELFDYLDTKVDYSKPLDLIGKTSFQDFVILFTKVTVSKKKFLASD